MYERKEKEKDKRLKVREEKKLNIIITLL